MPKPRNTKQRQTILEILQGTKTHPTADWLYQRVREKMPHVSLGTIYRNLGVLKEQGVIQELRHAGNQSRFDGDPSAHYHFFCEDCGRVDDVGISHSNQHDARVETAMPGYEVKGHNTEFYGLCPECNKKESEH